MANTLKVFRDKFFSEITEIPPLLQPSHLPSLDGLRGISIIMVLAYHALTINNHTDFNGMFGVNVFFVISGFIITTLLLKEKVTKREISLTKFYIRRILKIVPVAYLYLFLILLLNNYYKLITLPDILSAAFFIKNTHIIPTYWDEATGHFWSLSVEEQFYIIFPVILKKSANSYLTIIVLLIILIPVLLTIESNGRNVGIKSGVHIFLDFFRHITPILTGALSSILAFKNVIKKRFYPNNLVTNLLALSLAYEIFCGRGVFHEIYYKNFISSAIVAMIIVNNIAYSKDLFFKMLNSKILVSLGLASYSIYVWQQVFLMWHPWQHRLNGVWPALLNLAALLVVSFCSYYFIERQLARVKNRYR